MTTTGDPTRPATELREPLVRWLVRPAWLVVGLLAAGIAVAGDAAIPTWLQYLPLVASVLVLGLPHGAVDHLAPSRVRGEAPTPRALARVGLLYAVLGGAYAVAWFFAPLAGFVSFIALTWAHWGQGDVHALDAIHGVSHLRTRAQRLATAAVRGGLPMLVPLLAFPGEYRRVAGTIVARFGATPGALDPLFAGRTRLALAVGYGGLIVATLALGAIRARRADDRRVAGLPRSWAVDAGEVALLVAFFATVPPVLAVGVYFCLWHSARHVARLVLVDPRGRAALGEGRVAAALARFGRDAAPLTAASVGLLGGVYLLVPVRPTDLGGLVGLYLVLIAALTLPHVVVVSDMDRVERVWSPAPERASG
jgi:Brp/Blh family beta-carotene 15,15'-monooxygenase